MEEAYPELAFPVSNDNARCILCQQELDQNAAARLNRFENFVQDRTQKDEDSAKKALNEASLLNSPIWLAR